MSDCHSEFGCDCAAIVEAARAFIHAEDEVDRVLKSLTDDDDNTAMQAKLKPVVKERMAARASLKRRLHETYL